MSVDIGQRRRKILVLGLENSGKTSIILNFFGRVNLSDYNSLKETKSPNIVELKTDDLIFSIWDFNGKELDRNEFLKKFEVFIEDTNEIFYVIDIQDIKNYELALNFLQEIIEKVKKQNIKVEFTLFLHKYDLDIFDQFPDITMELIDNLIEKIKQIIPTEEFHEIYRSTIYTILDKIHIY